MRVLFKVLSVFILMSGIAFSQTNALKLAGRWPDGPCRTVAIDGNYAFINNGSALEILDISNSAAFKSVGKLDLDDYINCIRVSGTHAYVGGDNGIYIVDITDKSLPKKTGTAPLQFAISMFIKDNFVYAACAFFGFNIIDITTPSEPKTVSSSFYRDYYPSGVFVVDSLAYVSCADSGFYVMNVKDKSAPKAMGRYNFHQEYLPFDICVKDSIAYVTSGGRGSFFRYGRFHAFNINNPSNIFEESGITLTGNWRASGDNIVIDGNYAYVTSFTDVGNFVTVADISRPDSIKLVLKKKIDYASDMAIKGKRLFVSAGQNGLLSFDISSPALMAESGYFKTASPTGRVARKGDYLFVANNQSGLKVLDISMPSNPSEEYSCRGSSSFENCNTVVVMDSILLAGFSGTGYGLSIFSLRNMPGLEKISDLEIADVKKIAASGNYLYAATPYELIIYNIKDPYHPEKISNVYSTVRDLDIALNGSTLYLLEEMKRVRIFDLSNPANPALISNLPVLNALNFCLNGSYLYVSVYEGGTKIFDVSNPKNPVEVGKISDIGAYKIIVRDGLAYAFFTGIGLKIYNIVNPALPQLIKSDQSVRTITDMFIDKYYIILSQNSEGLSIFTNDIAGSGWDENIRIKDFTLLQNYPNPFNPATTISYSIPKASFVELKVFDLLGREVASLVNKEQTAGEYKVRFNASDLPSGMYVYQIRAGEFRDVRKMLIVK